MKFKKRDGIEYLSSDGHYFSPIFLTRKGGSSLKPYDSLNVSYDVGDDEESVTKNRETILSAFEITPEKLVTLNQVHGSDVLVLKTGDSTSRGGAYDAVVTDDPSLCLAILTADCVPVFITDHERGVFSAVHAGWRGTAGSIARKAVSVMVKEFSCVTTGLNAYIGPAIGICCYEVSGEVLAKLNSTLENIRDDTHRITDGRVYVDLKKFNETQLIESGISQERIEISPHCTSCIGDNFFSHRRENPTGRQMNFIKNQCI